MTSPQRPRAAAPPTASPEGVTAEREEEWREIQDFPGYRVSSLGRFTSPRGSLAPSLTKYGYYEVNLYYAGKARRHRIHRVVLEAFVGPCPIGMEGAHLNGNKSNNSRENLAWVTHAENCQHRILHGTQAAGERHGNAKLDRARVKYIRTELERGKAKQAIATELGVSRTLVRLIASREIWKNV